MKKKINKQELVEKSSKTITEFKEFISKGNVVELAVGVIIGGAFGKIVTSIVNDILMPLIGVIIGGVDFSNLSINVGNAVVKYGAFIQNVIDFLIIAVCVFFFVKIVDKFTKKEEVKVEVEEKKDEKIILLEEIRDLLKEKANSENDE